MVYRFTLTVAEQGPWIDADPNGQWVRYSDYAALAAQLAILEAQLAALSPAPEAQQEPVAYPKIMYCCEHCSEHAPEWCGYNRLDIYVTNDGRWLCDGCRENEGISPRECSSPPVLYPRPAE